MVFLLIIISVAVIGVLGAVLIDRDSLFPTSSRPTTPRPAKPTKAATELSGFFGLSSGSWASQGPVSSARSTSWSGSRRLSGPATKGGGLVRAVIVMAVASILVPVVVLDLLTATVISISQSGALPAPRPPVGSAITEVFDATGTKIATFQQFATNLPVTAADIPKVLKDAVVATEDRRFYDHRGIDPKGVVRALWADLNGGSYAQGASTIDQQYVRLVYGSNVRSLNRKLREAVLAGRVDSQLTKDQILVGYLSRVYLGGGSYGVGAAAASYFHKSVRDLTLSEAATLAGILPAPSAYDPRVDPTGADTRRIDVLAKMAAQGKITTAQESAADSQRLVLAGGDTPPGPAVTTVYPVAATATRYPWFVDYVRRYLVARFGAAVVARGGLRVETSLDPGMQAQAETAVAAALKGTQAPVDMAMVVLEPGTGLVKAMIGGRDFAASQVNTALGACPAATGPQSNDVPICI
ncbi:MAG: penicillin-binding protein, partial [Acidimicrobiaceae bacterium]|nr:penicillin-binding protein [Acidimicrobiaceae bacterium]